MRHQLSGEASSKDSTEPEASCERPAWGRATGEKVALRVSSYSKCRFLRPRLGKEATSSLPRPTRSTERNDLRTRSTSGRFENQNLLLMNNGGNIKHPNEGSERSSPFTRITWRGEAAELVELTGGLVDVKPVFFSLPPVCEHRTSLWGCKDEGDIAPIPRSSDRNKGLGYLRGSVL